MPDTLEKVEEYLESLEEYFFSSLAAATTDMPNIHEAVNRLWVDIARYGPGMPSFPEMHLPALGDFQVPPSPPPPPPPVPLSLLSRSTNWTRRHPWVASGIAVSVMGGGLLVGYNSFHSRKRKNYKAKAESKERRQVVGELIRKLTPTSPLINYVQLSWAETHRSPSLSSVIWRRRDISSSLVFLRLRQLRCLSRIAMGTLGHSCLTPTR